MTAFPVFYYLIDYFVLTAPSLRRIHSLYVRGGGAVESHSARHDSVP